MRKTRQTSGERIVKDIKRKTRKRYSAEEKIRIVLDGLRGEESIAELCRHSQSFQNGCAVLRGGGGRYIQGNSHQLCFVAPQPESS